MLFQSYLTGRKQVAKVKGCFSSEALVTSGVLQGSVLGPLLFIIFINNITDSIQHSEYFLYCDDLKLFSVSSIDKIQNDIDSLYSWSVLNELDFHPDKCKILSFSQRYNNAELSLNKSRLKQVDSIVDLGITVKSFLCWDKHVDLSIAKARKVLNFFKRSVPIGVYVSRRKLFYKSMKTSILEYGSHAWYPSISALRKMEKFQHRCIKWVLNCVKSDLESLKVLDILPVSFQLIGTDLLLLWKLLKGFFNSNLNATFVTSTSTIHHFGHFEISKNRKFKTDENFLNQSQRAANHLMRMKIIGFDMSKSQFTYAIDQFLRTQIEYFNLQNSCSFYMKCC